MKDMCFLCCEFKKLTVEHVIPQCLGGILKGKMYCAECNSKLGHKTDVVLSKNFGRYATLLNIKCERTKNQPFSLIDTNTGMKLHFDGKDFLPARDVDLKRDSNGELIGIEVCAPSKEERQKIANGILKKHKANLCLHPSGYVPHQQINSTHRFCIDSVDLRKAIAKIAYGFACYKLPKKLILGPSFSEVRKYLNDQTDSLKEFASANYEYTDFMTDNIRTLHKLYLSFNRSHKLVIGYVTLFGAFRYTVLLSDSFESQREWPDLDYTFDPILRKEVPVKLSFKVPLLSKEQVVNPRHSQSKVQQALNRGIGVIRDHSPFLKNITVVMNSNK